MSRTDKDRGDRKRGRNYCKTIRIVKRHGTRARRHGKTSFEDVNTVRTWSFYY